MKKYKYILPSITVEAETEAEAELKVLERLAEVHIGMFEAEI